MLKIIANHNRQDITYSFTVGQNFPDIQGKLISVEANGNELDKLLEVKEIPVNLVKGGYVIWHGRHAGSVLKILRELFDK